MNKSIFTETCGWYGVAALLTAYALASFGIFTAQDTLFQVLNITGSVGIIVDASAQKNWQPVVLNVVWAIVGIIVLIKFFL